MKRTIAAVITLIAVAGCSGSIKTSKIPNSIADDTATGLRYFLPRLVEISVYHVSKPEASSHSAPMKHRVDRVGDVVTDTINDTDALWQVTYQGALFTNQSVNLFMNDKGAVKSIGLTSQAGSTPVGLGALQAIQTGLETQRDFAKTREQTKIDDLNRQANLIKAREDLENALTGKSQ